MKKSTIPLIATLALVLSMLGLGSTAHADEPERTPIVFVHGQQGSALQWQSQAKRFSSNGYADDELYAYEYDTTVYTNDTAVAGLESYLESVLERTGASQVDLIAHSRGTMVAQTFLDTPERAALVRKYVNVDGQAGDGPPGGVETLALWSSNQPDGSFPGATDVHLDELGHTESTTSQASFGPIYRFLTGSEPGTTEVTPEPPDQVEISGRTAYYPENDGVSGTLRVYEIDSDTGARVGAAVHTVTTGADGSFGPLAVDGTAHYEMVLDRPGELTHHYYSEPYERSDHFVRLQVSRPGGVSDRVDRCASHSAFTVMRNREWYGGRDRLAFDGVDVLDEDVSPQDRQILGLFVFDNSCNRRSRLGRSVFGFGLLPFVSAVDHYVASSAGTVRVRETMRGSGEARTLAVRSWPSNTDAITVLFKDYADTTYEG